MKNLKKLSSLFVSLIVMISLFSCGSDEPTPEKPKVETNLKGVISENKTLTADLIWIISGRVIVDNGVTLTIEPGTIIKGAEGEGTNAAVLMVARGGKINAVGTATKPIIMTTVLDDIAVGQLEGTTLGNPGDKGKWGGLVILGKAPVSVDGANEAQIEGVPASETLGLYGGTVANDNSGTIKYVSIRYGGAVIDAAAGKEINGLTLGGVGSATSISHIEIFANVDDGVEFFGGTVNVSNVLVAYQGDDGLDVDQAYAGTVNNFLLLQDSECDEGLEIDGPEGSNNAEGMFTIKNGTIKSMDQGGSAADFKSKAQGSVTNVLYKGYPTATIKIRASYTNACTEAKNDAFMHLTAEPATLTFSQVSFDGVSVYTKSDDGNGNDCTVSTADQNLAAEVLVPATATGLSDKTVWEGWSLVALRNEL